MHNGIKVENTFLLVVYCLKRINC